MASLRDMGRMRISASVKLNARRTPRRSVMRPLPRLAILRLSAWSGGSFSPGWSTSLRVTLRSPQSWRDGWLQCWIKLLSLKCQCGVSVVQGRSSRLGTSLTRSQKNGRWGRRKIFLWLTGRPAPVHWRQMLRSLLGDGWIWPTGFLRCRARRCVPRVKHMIQVWSHYGPLQRSSWP